MLLYLNLATLCDLLGGGAQWLVPWPDSHRSIPTYCLLHEVPLVLQSDFRIENYECAPS